MLEGGAGAGKSKLQVAAAALLRACADGGEAANVVRVTCGGLFAEGGIIRPEDPLAPWRSTLAFLLGHSDVAAVCEGDATAAAGGGALELPERLLNALGAYVALRGPTLLFADDVHFWDPAAIQLLITLSVIIDGERRGCLIVATTRPIGAGGGGGGAVSDGAEAALRALRAWRHVAWLRLGPLSRGETSQLLLRTLARLQGPGLGLWTPAIGAAAVTSSKCIPSQIIRIAWELVRQRGGASEEASVFRRAARRNSLGAAGQLALVGRELELDALEAALQVRAPASLFLSAAPRPAVAPACAQELS